MAQVLLVGTSAMIGSGAVVYSNNSFMLKGIGDIINTSLVVIIACLIYMVLQNKLGSFELIILPVLVPIVRGYRSNHITLHSKNYSSNWKCNSFFYRLKSVVNVYTY